MIWFLIISVYTNDDNIIFYSLPEQHSQPDVEVILEKNGRCEKFTRNKGRLQRVEKNKIKIMQTIKNNNFLH